MHSHGVDPAVVTGMGLVLPTGRGVQPLWDAWNRSESAISPYRDSLVQTSAMNWFAHVPAELQALALESVPHKLRRYGVNYSSYAVLAAQDALQDCGEHWKSIDETRRAIYTGQSDSIAPSVNSYARALAPSCSAGEIDFQRLTHEALQRRGVDPFTIIKALSNNVLALVSLVHRFRGDCGAFLNDAAGTHAALARASFCLQHHYCDLALVVGAGSYNECLSLAEHRLLEHVSCGLDGRQSLRSFDQSRDGTVLGEGAVAFVLERSSTVRQRGGTALLEITALTSKSCSGTNGAAEKFSSAITTMLSRNPAVTPDLICADGKATRKQDAIEISIMEQLPGIHGVPVTSIRPITGELSAASPLADLAAITASFAHSSIPCIGNLKTPASGQLDFVMAQPRAVRATAALCTYQSFNGFYGASLVCKPH